MDLGFQARAVWLNVAAFLISSGVIWFAGTRLARYAKIVSDRTRLGEVFIGTLFLSIVVSLPEAVVSLTAAAMGNATLAVNTLLGGIVFSVLILAVTDAAVGGGPLSSDIRHPVVPLQGALAILMLVAAASGISTGDTRIVGVGAWTSGILVIYILAVWLVQHTQNSHPWVVGERSHPSEAHRHAASTKTERYSLQQLVCLIVLAVGAILVAGFVAAQTADALAEQTGLGSTLAGFLLGGIATSLPEASSTYSAARLERYEMVFSDAFGTNLFSVMLLFLCDVAFQGGPVLNEVGRFSLFATLLGTAVTAVYVAGLIGRPRKVILRMGIDSLLVLVMSVSGLLLLNRLR